MKKLLKLSMIALMLSTSVFAASDGENKLTKKNTQNKIEIKDCFEPLNRATFAFNQGLDKVIFKPVAKAYRILP
jgi:phospholipid-binding lipoprotein MlaA